MRGNGWSFGSLLPGVTLITLGLIFLADTYLGYTLHNWWALFILIPAFGSFSSAYEAARSGDRDRASWGFVAGAGFVALTAAFLLDLDVGRLWPLALIGIGLALLVTRRGTRTPI